LQLDSMHSREAHSADEGMQFLTLMAEVLLCLVGKVWAVLFVWKE
jgi:hypothetical protein